jgi:hypothetical protein
MVATHDVFTPFLVDASPFALYRLSMWVVYNVYVLGYNLTTSNSKKKYINSKLFFKVFVLCFIYVFVLFVLLICYFCCL